MSKAIMLGLFIVAIVAIGLQIGVNFPPRDWYAGLIKPGFTPPNWIFAPVWTTLYVIIAVVGWRTWLRTPRGMPMALWALQMLLNFIWSPLFFGLHRVDLAMAVITLTGITIAAFIIAVWRSDRLSALLFLPYLAWIGFASSLNGAILLLN